MKRVVFSVDEKTHNYLKSLQERTNSKSLGETITYALSITKGLNRKIDEGFTRVLMENPNTREVLEVKFNK